MRWPRFRSLFHFVFSGAGIAILAISCASNGAGRLMLPASFRPIWAWGVPPSDTIFSLPIRVLVTPAFVVVLDPGADRVIAFRVSSGAIAWILSGEERGTKMLRQPVSLGTGTDDQIIIGDAMASKITVIDRTGRIARVVSVPRKAGRLASVCQLGPHQYLIGGMGPSGPTFTVLDTAGKELVQVQNPFPSIGSKDREYLSLNVQIELVTIKSETGCVALQRVGDHFAVFRHGKFEAVHEYRAKAERHNIKQVTKHKYALTETATAVALDGTTLWIASRAATKTPNVLDGYDWLTGEYRGSLSLPRNVTYFGLLGPNLAILHGYHHLPVVSFYERRH